MKTASNVESLLPKRPESEMPEDARDQLWNVSFETYYDACYEGMVAEALVSEWQIADEITKVAVALTASGSAVAGWALWSEPGFKAIWALIAGIAAFVAVVHAALGVPSRVKVWRDVRVRFSGLRIDLETLRQNMRVNSAFPLEEYTEQHLRLRDRYKQGIEGLPNDLLQTRRLCCRVQYQLNERLSDVIVHDEGR